MTSPKHCKTNKRKIRKKITRKEMNELAELQMVKTQTDSDAE